MPDPQEAASRRAAEDTVNEWLDRDYHEAHRPLPTKKERERLVEHIAVALTRARDEERQRLRVIADHALDQNCLESCGEYGHGWHAADCPRTKAEGELYDALRAAAKEAGDD